MSRTSVALPLPSASSNGDEVERDGIVYRFNSSVGSSGQWQTVLNRNLTVVTKNNDQSYFAQTDGAVTVNKKANDALLNINEVDANVVNLKRSVLTLERDLKHFVDFLLLETDEVSQNLTTAQRDLLDAISDANDDIGALLTNAALTGVPTAPTVNVSDNTTKIATTEFVRNLLQNVPADLKPVGATPNLGGTASPWNNLYLTSAILPAGNAAGTVGMRKQGVSFTATYYNTNLGSPTNAFNELYVKEAFFGGDTINIGDATLTASDAGGVILPTNSAIGTAGNVIPQNFANTLIDQRFGLLSGNKDKLISEFTSSGGINTRDAVKLAADGTVTKITATSGKEGFIGFANSPASGNVVSVTVNGRVEGFTDLTPEAIHFLTPAGELTTSSAAENEKIGIALSSSVLFLFSASTIDTYVLNRDKVSFSDFSVSNQSPSGAGSLSYSDQSGAFSFTPPDLSSFATTSDVTSQINSLVDGAPGALNTLNELAEALGDNANFSTTVTNSLATKAPLNNPTFTGTPRVPEPASSSNDTQVATTAFVKAQSGSQTLNGLTNVQISDIRQDQVLAFDVSSQKFRNVNQSGVGGSGAGGTIDFVVDGGTATSVSSQVVIVLDGGTA